MKSNKIKRKLKKRSMLFIGLLLMVTAIILAFASIQRQTEVFEGEEKKLTAGGADMLETRFQQANSSIEMEFHPDDNDEDVNQNQTVVIQNNDFEVLKNITLPFNGTKEIELDNQAKWIRLNTQQGNLTYQQRITYRTQPYGLLSIPAFILTITGLVVTYQGKYQMKVEKKMKEHENLILWASIGGKKNDMGVDVL